MFPNQKSYDIKIIDLDFLGIPQSIASFLIRTEKGPILVETGPHSCIKRLKIALAAYGYKTEDIRHILITHIHLDHAGAAWYFASKGAKIYLHPFGFAHMNDPSRLLASAQLIYKERMDFLWGKLMPIDATHLQTVEDREVLDIHGLKFIAHHTPGHAKHHIAWQLESSLFTGDVAGIRISNGPVVPPCPPPDIDIDAWMKSLDKIQSLSQVTELYLSHFGKHEDKDRHVKELQNSLLAVSSFIKPFARKAMSGEPVINAFREFTEKNYRAFSLSESNLMSYESANPPDMSVSGLLRYWKRKIEHNPGE